MMKANELNRYLMGKQKKLDFSEPKLALRSEDDFELRQKVLNMTNKNASELGIIRSELHYLRKKAKSDKPFKVYGKVKERLTR
jgi:hypothetical protein